MDNYFNYFTEIERYYQTKRESFTLLTTLDWVLIESWKDQGIPLEIVLKGMDRAFSRAKRRVSSLAYCAHAVAEVIEDQKDLRSEKPAPPEFEAEQVQAYLSQLAGSVEAIGETVPGADRHLRALSEAIRQLDPSDMRAAETGLNAVEKKLTAILTAEANPTVLMDIDREVERNLAPVRSKMTTAQLSMLQDQLQKRTLLERFGVPRLSLFYMV